MLAENATFGGGLPIVAAMSCLGLRHPDVACAGLIEAGNVCEIGPTLAGHSNPELFLLDGKDDSRDCIRIG